MRKRYYQHSIWSDNGNEWIESDKECFNDEVITHRAAFIQRYVFEERRTIFYFDNRYNSAYDWKVVLENE